MTSLGYIPIKFDLKFDWQGSFINRCVGDILIALISLIQGVSIDYFTNLTLAANVSGIQITDYITRADLTQTVYAFKIISFP